MGLGLRAKKQINEQQEVRAFIAHTVTHMVNHPAARHSYLLSLLAANPECIDLNRSSSRSLLRTFSPSTRL